MELSHQALSFFQNGADTSKKAIEADHNGNYKEAFHLYEKAIQSLSIGLNYERFEERRQIVQSKLHEFLDRAAELRRYLPNKCGKCGQKKLQEKGDAIQIGLGFAKDAIEADQNGNFEEAFRLYGKSAEYIFTGLKYEKNEDIKQTTQIKLKEYINRALELKQHLPKHTCTHCGHTKLKYLCSRCGQPYPDATAQQGESKNNSTPQASPPQSSRGSLEILPQQIPPGPPPSPMCMIQVTAAVSEPAQLDPSSNQQSQSLSPLRDFILGLA